MSENNIYNVKNRSAGNVVYTIPELSIRREFAPGEVKKISFVELEKLTFIPGGKFLMAHYLQISESEAEKATNTKSAAEVNKGFNIKTEPEYFLNEAEIIALIKSGSHDAWLDALDFAPLGVIDLIKKLSVSVPLTDTEKIASLKKATGFDASLAIANDRADKEVETGAFTEKTATRRVKVEEPAAQPTRRTAGKYKIVNSEN